MKVCPLVTQAIMLENEDESLLVREADSDELEIHAGEHDEEEDRESPEEVSEDEIFMNPDVDPRDPAIEDEFGFDIANTGRPVRFIAKAYRGRVECLGDLCRFFDEANSACRFEMLFSAGGRADNANDETAGEMRSDIEKIWNFQQKSSEDILSQIKQQEDRTDGMGNSRNESIDQHIGELKDILTSVMEENKVIIESIADTLAEKTEEIEEKLSAGEQQIESFKSEISSWKECLDRGIDKLESGLGENDRILKELSRNHTEILEVVENQKKTFETQEKKQQISEAKRLNNAGVMAYHNGQYEKALELFRKAIDLNPEFTEGYNNLGLTYTETNEEEKATEAFKKAIELNPDLAATYNNLGYAFYRLGSYTEAIEMYQESIGRGKDNSAAYTNLGNAYCKLERIDDAIEAWNTAVSIDPSNEKARRNLKRFNAEVSESG